MFYGISLFLGSVALSYALNLIFIRFANKLGAVSAGDPSQQRWSTQAKPIVGGISFLITYLVTSLVYFSFSAQLPPPELTPLVISATLAFTLGLWDDAFCISPKLKFVGQIVCALILVSTGTYIQLFNIFILDTLLTIFWVVGIMNSVNMLDNMDGVTATVSAAIISCTLVLISFADIQTEFLFYSCIGLLGALIGFLFLNYNPSKLFMGDTGSMFLGLVLAFLGIKFFWNLPTPSGQLIFSRQLLLPVLMFLMPIMDTTFVFVARIRRGDSPFKGGKDHITHHLHYIGLHDKMVPVITGLVCVLSGSIVLSTLTISKGWSHFHTALFSGYILAMFGIFYFLYQQGKRMNENRLAEKAKQDALKRTLELPHKQPEKVS
ncbi:MAG: undecaprenyl/decaprenyl-phosphate alpha-N-acetylglucosaminyl 1-phosphate transferase [Bacteroidia bacterium]|nr:undecaprenyl/decaprenyl-phosphate alpha-N-acetylglucosaminyl 1-phosphate transferase [Bacteroidia bacterium]